MRLLVVDDHEVVRRGVRSLLADHAGWDVCGEAVDGQDAIEKARELRPDLIVMDVSMPRLNGLEATRQVRSILPDCEVLILSQHENNQMAQQAFKAGARGYVAKSSIARDLMSAVANASRHEYFFDPAVLDQTSASHIDVQEILERSAAFERALKDSEELYRSTFELTAVGIAHVSPEGRWLRVNQKLCDIVGYSEEELLNLTFQQMSHPDDLPGDLALTAKIVSGELPLFSMEKRYIRKDGSPVWINLTVSAPRNSDGTLKHFITVVEDISERKKVEESLRENEKANALLAAIVTSSDDAIVSKNLDGIIQSWNKSAERIFGYTAEEAIGKHITLIVPPDRRAEEDDILARLWRGERIDHFKTIRKHKNGTLIDVSLTISPVRDCSGRIIGASKVARDITGEKRAEQALRQSEQRYQAVTDASPVMIWVAGTDKLCYYFNKRWLDFVGRTLEQERGNGWAENVHPDDFDRCLQIYVSNFDARRSFEMEYRIRHHSGQYRWIFDRGIPLYAPDGTFEGYVGACLDIHERKEAAEKVRLADETVRLLKAQDEERRRIARDLHDSAGQTLTVLGLNLAQLVQNAEVVAPELAKEGKQIEEVVQQLHREIRTTSYLLHPPLLDEAGLSSALSWYVQGIADRSGIAIDLNISDDFARLSADMELAIFRVVQECLTNIHRHSGSKTARINIARENGSVRIEVWDQGKGISPERMAEIQSRGSGVGIAGIRERLRQFGGTMTIESGKSGTRVVANIPVPTEARSTDAQPLQAAV